MLVTSQRLNFRKLTALKDSISVKINSLYLNGKHNKIHKDIALPKAIVSGNLLLILLVPVFHLGT